MRKRIRMSNRCGVDYLLRLSAPLTEFGLCARLDDEEEDEDEQ
jgi:hypothetical protein